MNLLLKYPGFYSYTEGVAWKILDLLTETFLIRLSQPKKVAKAPGFRPLV